VIFELKMGSSFSVSACLSEPESAVSEMAAIEFTYFKGGKARGEPVRIALQASGVLWKDTSVTGPEFGEAKKAGKYRTGLPELKTPSGKVYSQSIAMARYAAKLGSSGLYPSDPEAALAADVVMDICQDALTKCPQDADAEVKKAKREEYANGRLKAYMDSLSKMIEESGGPFFCGKTLTVADLVAKYFLLDMIKSGNFDHIAPEYVDQWPLLLEVDKAIGESVIIKAYEASKA